MKESGPSFVHMQLLLFLLHGAHLILKDWTVSYSLNLHIFSRPILYNEMFENAAETRIAF